MSVVSVERTIQIDFSDFLAAMSDDFIMEQVAERGLQEAVLAKADHSEVVAYIRERHIPVDELLRDHDAEEVARILRELRTVVLLHGRDADEFLDLLAAGHNGAAYDLLKSHNPEIDRQDARAKRVAGYGTPAHLLDARGGE